MLTARAGGAARLHFDILGTNLNLTIVGYVRHYLNRRKARMPSAGSVKGRNAHQTVNAVFTLEKAIRIFSLNGDGR